MTTTEYLDRMQSLGIDRGRLAGQFPPELGSVGSYKGEGLDYTKSEAARTIEKPFYDLSHLTPKFYTLDAILGRDGMTVQQLAEATGLREDYIRQAVRGRRKATKAIKATIGAHLSDKAKKDLGWSEKTS